MLPTNNDVLPILEVRLRDAKIELFHCLLYKDKEKLSELEVEMGFLLAQDDAIQNRLEAARIDKFKTKLRSTKPCHCFEAWGDNEPCPRHGWSDASEGWGEEKTCRYNLPLYECPIHYSPAKSENTCVCKSTDARECIIIRVPKEVIPFDYKCECSCHQQGIGYADVESTSNKKKEESNLPPGPPDLSDIEKKIKPFFYG